MIRIIRALADGIAASLELSAAQAREATKRYEDQQWIKGYTEGVGDARGLVDEVARLRREIAVLAAEEGEK